MLHFDRTTASVVYISIWTSISTYAVIRVYLAVRIFRSLSRKKKKKKKKKGKRVEKRDKSLAKVPRRFDRLSKNKRVYLLIYLSKIRSTNCRDKIFREISKFAKFHTVEIINSLLDAYGVTGKTNELVNWLSNLSDIITTFLIHRCTIFEYVVFHRYQKRNIIRQNNGEEGKSNFYFPSSFVIASTIIEHTWIQVAEARGAAVCNSWPYEPRWDLDSSTNHSSRVTNVSSNCEHLYSRSESAFEIEDEPFIRKEGISSGTKKPINVN